MKIKGTVKFISEAVTGTSGSGKDWKKQSVVIEEDGQYPNSAVIDWFNKDINFVVGDEIEVEFNIKATEFNGKRFNNLSAWTWTAVGGQTQQNSAKQATYPHAEFDTGQPRAENIPADDETSDLPF